MVRRSVIHELEDFVRSVAPLVSLTVVENPSMVSLRLEAHIGQSRRLIGESSDEDREVADQVADMLSQIQRAAVTGFGLEDWLHHRSVVVIDLVLDELDGIGMIEISGERMTNVRNRLISRLDTSQAEPGNEPPNERS